MMSRLIHQTVFTAKGNSASSRCEKTSRKDIYDLQIVFILSPL